MFKGNAEGIKQQKVKEERTMKEERTRSYQSESLVKCTNTET